MGDLRLGDIIDDYCVKCKRIMNHAVVSLVNGEPAKVRCRTCHNDHDYRHEQPPPPKADTRKGALFNEVLAKVSPGSSTPPPVAEPFLEEHEEDMLHEEETIEEEPAEEEPAEAQPVRAAAPKSKAAKPKAAPRKKTATKAKGRPKARG